MRFKEYDTITLTKAYNNVPKGSKGAILMRYEAHCEIEFIDNNGVSIAIETVPNELIKIVQ